jgi:PPOX class probable F420-dependent enzyme
MPESETAMSKESRAGLPKGPYLSLVTFRRDGREVATPVWFAEVGGRLYAYTLRDAGKLKRLRHNPRVRVAECTFAGKVTGSWREGSAKLMEHPGVIQAAYAGLRRKYGWQYQLTTFFSWLTRRIRDRRVVEIVLDAP